MFSVTAPRWSLTATERVHIGRKALMLWQRKCKRWVHSASFCWLARPSRTTTTEISDIEGDFG